MESEAEHHIDPIGAPEVPEAPWLKPPRKPRTRVQLSREAIVDAALRLLDREGAPGFSMRRLAEELGVGAGAVYWHVANREQLLQLVFDRVIGELPMPEPDPERWREQIKQAARDEREMMARHPGIAQLSFGRIPVGPNAVRYMEWHLSILRAGGLSDRVASLAGDMIYLFIGAFSFEECLGLAVPNEGDASARDFIGQLREYFASLPADRFPNLSELSAELTSGGPDVRFEFGLDVLLDGLVAQSQRETG
ncbi:MAG: TetR/AcrR family transcriptional regulator [Gaiellaceae bacterium]